MQVTIFRGQCGEGGEYFNWFATVNGKTHPLPWKIRTVQEASRYITRWWRWPKAEIVIGKTEFLFKR